MISLQEKIWFWWDSFIPLPFPLVLENHLAFFYADKPIYFTNYCKAKKLRKFSVVFIVYPICNYINSEHVTMHQQTLACIRYLSILRSLKKISVRFLSRGFELSLSQHAYHFDAPLTNFFTSILLACASNLPIVIYYYVDIVPI